MNKLFIFDNVSPRSMGIDLSVNTLQRVGLTQIAQTTPSWQHLAFPFMLHLCGC